MPCCINQHVENFNNFVNCDYSSNDFMFFKI